MPKHKALAFGTLVLLLIATACATEDARIDNALATITVDDITADIQILSSDAFEGRGPSSAGEEKTIAFLRDEFEGMGLEPGNGDSWFQEVPLVSLTADPDMTLSIRRRGSVSQYDYAEGFIAWTTRVVDAVDLEDSEMVFVGYGIVAPEYGWNDYEGLDVAGKTVVMLVNDPGYATEDPAAFNGRSMTYYGRWTYKYEEAARQGAAAALIVHETGPAGYGWVTVANSWSGPQFDLVRPDDNMSRIKVEGWIHIDAAPGIFEMAGLDYEELKAAAAQPGFEPVPMGLTASVAISNTIDRSTSNNVLALLPGSGSADEYVIYMAHWDHLGLDPSLEGDQVYNGALDNATGTAGLLELAEAFTSLDPRPSRSILFAAVTAEEQGLLGSAHYAVNPVHPLEKTVAAINMDGANIYGRTTDIVVVGYGNSELDDLLAEAAMTQNRHLVPDPDAEKGYYYRSDHFELAKEGVPALYTDSGDENVEFGAEYTRQKKDEYIEQRYHMVTDEYSDDWDLTGAVDDLQLFFLVGYKIASGSSWPNWKEGTEFKAIRDAMMSGGTQ